MLGKKPVRKNKKSRSKSKSKSKSKGRHMRTNTFNSSEFSMIDDRLERNVASSSLCDLFRHDPIKRKIQNSISGYSSIPSKKRYADKGGRSAIVRNLGNIAKNKPKKRNAKGQRDPEPYERVNPSNSSSDLIIFSQEDTTREKVRTYNGKVIVHPMVLQDNYLITKEKPSKYHNDQHRHTKVHSKDPLRKNNLSKNSNSFEKESCEMFRETIKKKYQKREEAATKIQKVFRGYLTRKILLKYVSYQEKKLHEQRCSMKSQKIRPLRKGGLEEHYADFDGHAIFNDGTSGLDGFHLRNGQFQIMKKATSQKQNQQSQGYQNGSHHEASSNTFQGVSHNQFEISEYSNHHHEHHRRQKTYEDDEDSEDEDETDPLNTRGILNNFPYRSNQHGVSNYRQQEYNSESEQDDSSEGGPIPAYIHQKPIYSHEEISEFLQNSDSDENDQYGEEDDIYEPNVIFQTNEEYLESRKTSLQNKNSTDNQLANPRSNQSQQPEIRHFEGNQIDQQPLKRGSMEVDKTSTKKGFLRDDNDEFNKKKYSYEFQQSSHLEQLYKEPVMPTIPSHHLKAERKPTEEEPGTNPSEVMKTEDSSSQAYAQMTFQSEDTHPLTETYSFPKTEKSITDQQSQSHERVKKSERPVVVPVPRPRAKSPKEQLVQFAFLKKSKEEQNSCSSSSLHKSLESQLKVQRLKDSEKERWQQVSEMITEQVLQNKQKNSQISEFMHSILDLCQRNKELLSAEEMTDADHTTPTTTIEVREMHDLISLERTQYQTIDDSLDYQPRNLIADQMDGEHTERKSQFRKKKNLEIQIAEGASKEEKLSLSKSKETQDKGFKRKEPKETQQTISISPRNIPLAPVPKTYGSTFSQRRKSKEDLIELSKHNEQKLSVEEHCGQDKNNSSIKDSFESSESEKNMPSFRQQTFKLRNFLSQNIQNDSLQEMLGIRQSLLQKRQCEMLIQLNNDLSKGKLHQEQFIKRLSQLTKRFEEQKASIDKARSDIERGYQAAMGLVKQTYSDAKRLGVKINLSRSLGNLKTKEARLMQNVIVDQFHCYTPNSKSQKRLEIQSAFGDQGKQAQEVVELKNPSITQKPENTRSIQKPPELDIRKTHKEYTDQLSESSSVEFTEEELQRFRKIQPYDSEFLEMNKNITISEDFLKQHLTQNHQQTSDESKDKSEEISSACIKLTSQAYRQVYEVDIDQYPHPLKNPVEAHPLKDKIAMMQLQKLIYECAIEILQKPVLNEKLIDRTYLSKPQAILKAEQELFINILEQNFPVDSVILQKLNQKISPLPTELLRCMRIDFSDENQGEDGTESSNGYNEENQYEEIGKYEFIIGQEVCAHTIIEFRSRIDDLSNTKSNLSARSGGLNCLRINKNTQKILDDQYEPGDFDEDQHNFEELNNQLNFQPRVVRYMNQREKFISNRKKHTKGLRWEILNIQVHSIFDAWNEQLIQLRTRKPGYSGIGLNELSLSTIDQNRALSLPEVNPLLLEGKQKLMSILEDTSELNDKMLKQNFEQMCYTDSTWIYYADEALSYGLELGYLVEQEIFMECVREIIKKFHGGDLLYFGGIECHENGGSEDEQYPSYDVRGVEDQIEDLEAFEIDQVSFDSGRL